jgi:pimeloyl-ACP methyl ester carboxylesterase
MTRRRVLGELVTFKDATEFHHDGILYERRENRTTIVHVHGSFGNFYQNEFLRVMAETYLRGGINFLSFNLRGHDALTEGYRHEWDFEYAGGAITSFDSCVQDLQGAVDFVSPISDRVILQGHSMGCDRVLHYMLSTGNHHESILLSPCDSYELQADWIAPETAEQQVDRLRAANRDAPDYDWLPLNEYGIRRGDWSYSIPITRPSFLSVVEGPAFKLVRLSKPAEFFIDQRMLIYIGGDDTLQTAPRDAMLTYFTERVADVRLTSLYPEGDHSLWGCEEEVSNEIVAWVNEQSHQPRT